MYILEPINALFFLLYLTSGKTFPFSIYILCFVLYNRNDLNHRRPALTALTFPAAYNNL